MLKVRCIWRRHFRLLTPLEIVSNINGANWIALHNTKDSFNPAAFSGFNLLPFILSSMRKRQQGNKERKIDKPTYECPIRFRE